MARKIRKAKAKIVKKKWIKIEAPKFFNNQVIGETYVVSAEATVGKTITISLMVLTKDPKKQNTYVTFKIIGVKENAAQTEFVRMCLSTSAAKRLARRNKDKVADSIEVITGDKKKVRVKPVIITRNKVSKPTQTDLRKKTREFIAYKFSKTPVEQLTQDLISKEFQRSLSEVLRKICPVSVCEIRDFIVIPEKSAQ